MRRVLRLAHRRIHKPVARQHCRVRFSTGYEQTTRAYRESKNTPDPRGFFHDAARSSPELTTMITGPARLPDRTVTGAPQIVSRIPVLTQGRRLG